MDHTIELESEEAALVRLWSMEGLGPVRIAQLVAYFGSAKNAVKADSSQLLKVPTFGPKLVKTIRESKDDERYIQSLSRMRKLGVDLILSSRSDYPQWLNQIHDAPVLLTVRGSILPCDQAAIAIVGSRRCSSYGKRMAYRLAYDLASRGVTIISGLARGIDAEAHKGAMDANGRTLAVLACGLAKMYPPEHAELAERVVEHGALISENQLDASPMAGMFPQRNRIISGLSLGVVVVEAALRSGALSTARHALEQDRDVFAVPGRVGELSSEGSNRLIQEGASLVTCVDDILDKIGPMEWTITNDQDSAPAFSTPPVELSDKQRMIYEAMGTQEVEMESLLEKLQMTASELSGELLFMEMKKVIERLPGAKYVRK